MNNKKEIIIMAIIAAILVVVAIVGIVLKSTPSAAQNKYKTAIEKEADSIKKTEMIDFTIIDVDKYLELYKSKDANVVMIGRTGCEYCQIAEPIVKHIAYKNKFKVYYLSLDTFSDSDKTKLLNSDEYFKETQGVNTPMLLITKNNSLVDYIPGLVSTSEYVEFFENNSIIDSK